MWLHEAQNALKNFTLCEYRLHSSAKVSLGTYNNTLMCINSYVHISVQNLGLGNLVRILYMRIIQYSNVPSQFVSHTIAFHIL